MSTLDTLNLVKCPFDPHHWVKYTRFSNHILTCSKTINMEEYVICHFDYHHIVRKGSYANHIRECDAAIEHLDEQKLILRKLQICAKSASEKSNSSNRALTNSVEFKQLTLPPVTETPSQKVTTWLNSNQICDVEAIKLTNDHQTSSSLSNKSTEFSFKVKNKEASSLPNKYWAAMRMSMAKHASNEKCIENFKENSSEPAHFLKMNPKKSLLRAIKMAMSRSQAYHDKNAEKSSVTSQDCEVDNKQAIELHDKDSYLSSNNSSSSTMDSVISTGAQTISPNSAIKLAWKRARERSICNVKNLIEDCCDKKLTGKEGNISLQFSCDNSPSKTSFKENDKLDIEIVEDIMKKNLCATTIEEILDGKKSSDVSNMPRYFLGRKFSGFVPNGTNNVSVITTSTLSDGADDDVSSTIGNTYNSKPNQNYSKKPSEFLRKKVADSVSDETDNVSVITTTTLSDGTGVDVSSFVSTNGNMHDFKLNQNFNKKPSEFLRKKLSGFVPDETDNISVITTTTISDKADDDDVISLMSRTDNFYGDEDYEDLDLMLKKATSYLSINSDLTFYSAQ